MANILVTGSNGQLGNEIRELAKQSAFEFSFTDVAELDITDINAIDSLFRKNSFDYVINCAAYTNVNKAEEEEQLAHKINALAPENIAKICKTFHCKFIHVSTDYVLEGTHYQPYVETDKVCPQTAYGRTKLEGEQLIQKICDEFIIIRTAWLYSTFGNNFVKTMIKLGTERDEINVVFDQIGSPTNAADLAKAILTIISQVENKTKSFVPGIYHFTNEGVCSWYDFTKEIHTLAHIKCSVLPIDTKDFPSPAKRPFYSVLNKKKIKDTYNVAVPYWKDSLALCIKKLQE